MNIYSDTTEGHQIEEVYYLCGYLNRP